MNKGKLVAIGIGIVVAVAIGIGLAISAQSQQNEEIVPSETPGGRHFEVELKENVGIKDTPTP